MLIWNGRDAFIHIHDHCSSGEDRSAVRRAWHTFQQSQTVLLALHQDGTKQGRRCSHSTWSLDDSRPLSSGCSQQDLSRKSFLGHLGTWWNHSSSLFGYLADIWIPGWTNLLGLLRSKIPSVIYAKLHCGSKSFTLWQQTTIEFTRRNHSYCLIAPHICMVLFFAHIPFVVNRAFNATPAEWLQQDLTIRRSGFTFRVLRISIICTIRITDISHLIVR